MQGGSPTSLALLSQSLFDEMMEENHFGIHMLNTILDRLDFSYACHWHMMKRTLYDSLNEKHVT